ncbi:MAG TPA: aromatic ring-hydroxylating dioxygenase subunit alpha [Candidatus Binataceae bacterium]|nr:aromatic ring-hydroxylating dioxygenase subunit alpha [Candidatus Binataceae bacterium]
MEETQMFVRNCWYVPGWSRDFAKDSLTAVTILNEPIVIYRKSDGGLVALQDRCCHRFAPLSLGRLEGEDLRCMYHGLKFAPSGKCIEIPGQPKIPPQAWVRGYPIVEKHSCAWIWMGDPALADETLIPDFVGVDDPQWAMTSGRMDYSANYMLINDNLLDLSHIAFLHRKSLGATFSPEGVSRPTVTKVPGGVRIQNWINSGPSQMVPSISKGRVDIFQTYDFMIPGVFLLRADMYPEGTAKMFPDREAIGIEPLHCQFTCQAVTPLTDDRTCYFFAYGPWAKERQFIDAFYQLGLKAFNEDRVMIEAQQKNINLSPAYRMMTIAIDSGIAQFRRMIDDVIRSESNGAAVPQPPATHEAMEA